MEKADRYLKFELVMGYEIPPSGLGKQIFDY